MDNELKFDYYLHTKRLAEATRKSVIKQVNSFLQWLEGESIPDPTETSYNDVMAYVKHCNKQGNSQKTIAIKLMFLNHYFMWQIKEGEMQENPVSNIRIKGVKRKHLHHILKREALNYLYNNYYFADVADIRDKVILGMIVYQALRVEELTNLTIKSLSLKEAKIRVEGSRKANARTLMLEPHQLLDIMEYVSSARPFILQQTRKETDRLFTSSGTGDKLLNTLQHILVHVKKLDKEVKDWKQIRASVISYWISLYGLRKAQYLAGHRFISSTEEYQQQDLDELQGDIDRFHPL
ncbi:tyrosine-type recombinase/integrase [Sediminibacterium soli]|uniref:tyrosine-type recombinase/integrase n=1 Tax=Sediminibacterium soli TaxID=2698829 RepID=UPI00137B2AE4|nr:tyrosine-type recombinase/integrase [Sediminibacterium soli]NCI45664.1 tyrosine-type recombinase/integrase [Sediminibacterium soli]